MEILISYYGFHFFFIPFVGKPKGSEGGGRLWQASDEEQGGGDQDASGSFLRKGVVDLSDNSDVDVRSSGGSSREGQRRDLKKSNKGHEWPRNN